MTDASRFRHSPKSASLKHAFNRIRRFGAAMGVAENSPASDRVVGHHAAQSGALRRCITDVPVDKRIPVLIKCINNQPADPRWAIAATVLFLLAFFFAVFFGAAGLFALLGKMLHLAH